MSIEDFLPDEIEDDTAFLHGSRCSPEDVCAMLAEDLIEQLETFNENSASLEMLDDAKQVSKDTIKRLRKALHETNAIISRIFPL